MIKKAVIPLAGLGSRLLPVTKVVPKELFPIGNKPVLLYLLEECVASGIEEVILVISSRKKLIQEFLTKDFSLIEKVSSPLAKSKLQDLNTLLDQLTITYVIQDEPKGTADAILKARNHINQDEDFVILYGDDYIKGAPMVLDMIKVHEEFSCSVLGVRKGVQEELSLYGIVSYQSDGTIKEIVEKPKENAPSNDISIGRYLVNAKIFEVIETLTPVNGEYLFTDALNKIMKEETFKTCEIKGNYFDLGTQKGYLDANLSEFKEG